MPYIVNYLSKGEETTEIYLVPGAFITERKGNVLSRISDNILTPEDIRDTLIAFRSHTPFALGPLSREGMFSFGVRDIGRFRVSYITQRGSYVVHILKTPYHIPPIHKLCPDRETVNRLEEIIRLHNSGIILFQSKNQVIVSTLVYSLLQRISENYNKVIFILESPLSFLLKHGQSLVIQREVGVDVESFEEGLRDTLYLNPDILYVGQRDFIPSKEIEHILRIIESNTLVILNLPVVGESFFKSFRDHVRVWVDVETKHNGETRLFLKDIQPQALENR
ncbi:MAG: twitching motility protein [Aquificaceae bacterium]|nr:twitching motility protein [Aquificaceae bacterium]MDW8423890.1 twitching motility protein [Aquificaceae bacterium]